MISNEKVTFYGARQSDIGALLRINQLNGESYDKNARNRLKAIINHPNVGALLLIKNQAIAGYLVFNSNMNGDLTLVEWYIHPEFDVLEDVWLKIASYNKLYYFVPKNKINQEKPYLKKYGFKRIGTYKEGYQFRKS